jgi:hypothetical protein
VYRGPAIPLLKILLANLDEINAPIEGSADAFEKRNPGHVPAVGDVIKEGTLDGNSGPFKGF